METQPESSTRPFRQRMGVATYVVVVLIAVGAAVSLPGIQWYLRGLLLVFAVPACVAGIHGWRRDGRDPFAGAKLRRGGVLRDAAEISTSTVQEGHRAIWSGRWSDRIRSALRGPNRDPARVAAMRQSWRKVQGTWGFVGEDEPNIRRGLLMEMGAFSLVGLIGVMSTSYLVGLLTKTAESPSLLLFCAPLLIPVGVVGVVGRLWRYRVITTHQFVPFREWLVGGVGANREDEDHG